jgi:hypothetical protein
MAATLTVSLHLLPGFKELVGRRIDLLSERAHFGLGIGELRLERLGRAFAFCDLGGRVDGRFFAGIEVVLDVGHEAHLGLLLQVDELELLEVVLCAA